MRHDFPADELDAALDFYRAHGFTIVRKLADPAIVADLRDAVDEVLAHEPGPNRTSPEFVERSPLAVRLLDCEPYVEFNRRLLGNDALTIHRSFAVLKDGGSDAVAWHRDFHHLEGDAPGEPDQFLDPGDHGARMLWYLDGSYPDAGGLWLIPDSHVDDWPGPNGFVFTPGRKSFHREGEPAQEYDRFDAPEMLPLTIDPGDLLLYSLRLYHGAAPQPAGRRRACAVLLRATDPPLRVPWPETETSRRFLETLPPRFAAFARNYVGIDYRWRGE